MNRDLDIKTMQLSLTETSVAGIARTKQITITEKDKIDLEFKYKISGSKKIRVYGEVLKIGIDDVDNRVYIVVIAYNYSENNVFKIHTNEIVRIINLVHSIEPYSFQPVINPDETAILIKAVDGILFFSSDGENWIPAGGSGTGDDSGKAYVENGTLTDQSTSETVPTSNVVYATIIEQINTHATEADERITNLSNSVDSLSSAVNSLTTNFNNYIDDTERSFSTITNSFNTALEQRDSRVNDLEERTIALEEAVQRPITDNDIYNECVAQGWNGTREDFASALVYFVNNILNIPVVDDQTAEP